MEPLTRYFVGEREYRTDGAIMFVEPAQSIDVSRVAGCEKTADKILSGYADKTPVVLSVEYLKELAKSIGGQAVSVYIEGPEKPVLFVSDEKRFAIVMPLSPFQRPQFPCAAQPCVQLTGATDTTPGESDAPAPATDA